MKTLKHKFRNSFIVLLLLVMASAGITSCTERIDIPLDEDFVRLVVEGAITTDTTAHTIKLTSTSSYYANEPSPSVQHANVSITDGTTTFELSEVSPGIYQTASNVYGLPGHTYTLKIELAETVGGFSTYTASSTLYPVAEMDSVGLLFHKEWGRSGIWEVKCYVQEPPSVDYYRFMLYRNSTLMTDSIPEWFVVDDKLFNGGYTNGASVGYINQGNPAEGLKPGDTITLEVNSIGKDYYNFVWQVQSAVQGSNPLFSGPPANVKGNVSDGAIGFFAAYSSTRKYALVPEGE